MVSFLFCLDDAFNLMWWGHSWGNKFQEPRVPQLVKKSFIRLHRLKETQVMAVAVNSRSSLHVEK